MESVWKGNKAIMVRPIKNRLPQVPLQKSPISISLLGNGKKYMLILTHGDRVTFSCFLTRHGSVSRSRGMYPQSDGRLAMAFDE